MMPPLLRVPSLPEATSPSRDALIAARSWFILHWLPPVLEPRWLESDVLEAVRVEVSGVLRAPGLVRPHLAARFIDPRQLVTSPRQAARATLEPRAWL